MWRKSPLVLACSAGVRACGSERRLAACFQGLRTGTVLKPAAEERQRYGASPRYTQRAVQVSATTTSVSRGSLGLSLFQIQMAMFSLVGFFKPGISLR